jgi:hypothetical protein
MRHPRRDEAITLLNDRQLEDAASGDLVFKGFEVILG